MTRAEPGPDLLAAVARAVDLEEGAAGVEAFLRGVARTTTGRLADVARAARLPLPVAAAVRRELEAAGVLARDGGLALTDAGRRLVEDGLGVVPRPSLACAACAGFGVAPPPPGLLEAFTALLAAAPTTDVTLDQTPATPATSLRRALRMLEADAVDGRRVLVLGDDDSLGLALPLVARAVTGRDLVRPVTVVELDPRRVGFLRDVAAAERLPLEVVPHDLRAPLPAALRGRFDVFQTDPPYTPEGARLFCSRGVEALDPGGGRLGFLSFAARPPGRQLELVRLLADLGLAPTAMHPAFNAYLGASVLGGVGQWLELVHEPSEVRAPLPDGPWTGPLYSADANPRARRYRCNGCRRVVELGADGAPTTIEALKAAGCPACRGTAFHRLAASRTAGRPDAGPALDPPRGGPDRPGPRGPRGPRG